MEAGILWEEAFVGDHVWTCVKKLFQFTGKLMGDWICHKILVPI